MIPYGRQSIDADDIEAVARALQSDYLTTGPMVEAFEQAFAEAVGAKYAVAVNNGTAALHLAMLVAGIGSGDRVVTSPNTFLASANCAAMVGAIPDFVDIDPISYNLCSQALAEGWQVDTKAVVAVAYGGQACDMPAIAELARAKGALVIEDGCHGVGGGFAVDDKAYKIGGHPWADMTTFSFHPVKGMTTGEGGMLVSNNLSYAQQARKLRSHGMTRNAGEFIGFGSEHSAMMEQGTWYYEMQALGYNYRLSDVQCALGLSQLKKLPTFIQRRREIVARYNAAFADVTCLQPPQLRAVKDVNLISWHLYTVLIDFAALGRSRSIVMHQLREMGIATQVLYIPVYLQPYYQQAFGYRAGKCPRAEAYYQQALSLPLFPGLSDEEVQHTINSVYQVFKGCGVAMNA